MKFLTAGAMALLLSVAVVAVAQDNPGLEHSQKEADQLVQKAKQTSQHPAALPTNKVVSLSALLDGASDAAKLEFLGSIRLVDGKVASVSTDLLERELGRERVRQIIAALNPHPKDAYLVGPFHTMTLCNEHECDGAICHSDDNGTGCVSRNNSTCFGPCSGLQ